MAAITGFLFVILWSVLGLTSLTWFFERFSVLKQKSVAPSLMIVGAFFTGYYVSATVRNHSAPLGTIVSVTSNPAAIKPADVSRMCSQIRSVSPDTVTGFLDRVVVNGSNIASMRVVDRTDALSLNGWAADSVSKSPALAVCPMVDGKTMSGALSRYGFVRPDVALSLGEPSMSAVGYAIRIPNGGLGRGRHTLRAFAVLPGGRSGMLDGAVDITVR